MHGSYFSKEEEKHKNNISKNFMENYLPKLRGGGGGGGGFTTAHVSTVLQVRTKILMFV